MAPGRENLKQKLPDEVKEEGSTQHKCRNTITNFGEINVLSCSRAKRRKVWILCWITKGHLFKRQRDGKLVVG